MFDITDPEEKRRKYVGWLFEVEETVSNCLYRRRKLRRPKLDILQAIHVYDFAVATICRELAAESITDLFQKDLSAGPIEFFPTLNYTTKKGVSLSGYHIIANIYDRPKLAGAIQDEFQNGHVYPTSPPNTAILYPEIKLVSLENGRHHQAVASLRDEAYADTLTVVPLKEMFGNLTTDGAFWQYAKDGEKMKRACLDFRFPVLYTLARRRFLLAAEAELFPPDHGSEKAVIAALQSVPEHRKDVLQAQANQIADLCQEITLLRCHITRLENKLTELGISDEILSRWSDD